LKNATGTTWKEGGIGPAQIAGHTYFLELLQGGMGSLWKRGKMPKNIFINIFPTLYYLDVARRISF
jgi:hypothetical protein